MEKAKVYFTKTITPETSSGCMRLWARRCPARWP